MSSVCGLQLLFRKEDITYLNTVTGVLVALFLFQFKKVRGVVTMALNPFTVYT